MEQNHEHKLPIHIAVQAVQGVAQKHEGPCGGNRVEGFDKRVTETSDTRAVEPIINSEERRSKETKKTEKGQEEKRLQKSGYSKLCSFLEDMKTSKRIDSALRFLLDQARQRLLTLSGKDSWEAFENEYHPAEYSDADPLPRVQALLSATQSPSQPKLSFRELFMICFPEEKGYYETNLKFSKDEIWQAVTALHPGVVQRREFENIFQFAFTGRDTNTPPIPV